MVRKVRRLLAAVTGALIATACSLAFAGAAQGGWAEAATRRRRHHRRQARASRCGCAPTAGRPRSTW